MDYTPPVPSVPGIFQARILEWVAIPFSRGSSQLKDQTLSAGAAALAGTFFVAESRGYLPSNHAV